MQKVSSKSLILISLTLFSMFFGAGNFIFPPFIGSLAGENTLLAMAGFCLTAVVFPILGIAAIARSGGLYSLASRISPRFAIIFSVCLLMIIGPLFAIPRAGNMPFEIAIVPFLSEGLQNSYLPLFIYSIIYFVINWFLCQNPSSMIETLGKILTPMLIVLILTMFIAVLINPMHVGEFSQPIGNYAKFPIITGVLEGYQTMDALASLNFGLLVLAAYRSLGVTNEKAVVSATIKAGVIAGAILMTMYMILSYIGASSMGTFGVQETGASILSNSANFLFGKYGILIFGTAIGLACLTTTVGLISSISEYFESITKIKYKTWVSIWSALSALMANLGLVAIIKYAIPFLGVIYPLALTLIILSLLNGLFKSNKIIYSWTIYVVLIISLFGTFDKSFHITGAGIFSFLPFYEQGLEWVVPAIIVAFGSLFIVRSKLK
ncbi:branched-chain amino acid transport system II carrier protein [Campylobacter blaseri]|uniref:Branched-chain amino acid transport system II carrier protein n=1 Tax=Campylobacter blaseri TaxID=2042961 RepID=A0A2P8R188_9BACT|nr:branched-chain amino acid transport system II carrier protein [Campylobacter blaseri]PSM52259.1 branched-chain amino acid transport system II carrier protein [Campylobacter blaseri]PSM54025.1 branched-chain amino acid transport system II carrier protein [Campylobacter blaseri]QKF85463.1 branched-chain amino acid transport system II carrier protein [Campylobacter blaseri]